VSKIKKIEPRTNWFITAYNKLADEGRLPSNVELAEIMDIPSKSTITNILKRDQNIQPDQWEKFKTHFKLEDGPQRSEKTESEPSMRELLGGLVEGFKAIAATMNRIEGRVAQESSLIEIRDEIRLIASRQKGTGDVLLHSLERLEEKQSGELVREADKRIFQIDKEVRKRGNADVPRR
jgi:hypothetical protein